MKKLAKRLIIKARRNIFGELAGNNISKKAGDGFDFYELRPYTYGEDIRRIDWKTSAKMQEPFVKLFHQEREIQVVIVPILSGSLRFGLQRLKQEIVAELVAILGFSALKNSDRYCVVKNYSNTIKASKLSKNQNNLHKEVEEILSLELLGIKPNFQDFTNFISQKYKKRSLIVFISDFWEIPNFGALAKKHEVLSLVVRDNFEENPKELGSISRIDANTLQSEDIVLDKVSLNHAKKMAKAHDRELFSSFLKQGIRAKKIYTDENIYSSIRFFLGK